MTHPLIAWDSDIDDPDVVWHSRLDGRYHIEVVRVNSHAGELRIFDHDAGDEMVHSVSVGLMYGAQFGPDIAGPATLTGTGSSGFKKTLIAVRHRCRRFCPRT